MNLISPAPPVTRQLREFAGLHTKTAYVKTMAVLYNDSLTLKGRLILNDIAPSVDRALTLCELGEVNIHAEGT